jgi:hypothetical protein
VRALAAALVAACLAFGAARAAPDPLEPRTAADPAAAGPLAMLTVVSGDLGASRRYFEGAFALQPRPFAATGREAAALRAFWGLAADAPVRGLIFTRPGVAGAASVRVLEATAGAALARPGHDTEYPGPLAMGFPVSPMKARDPIAAAMGFPAHAGVVTMTLNRADGSTYPVDETHYRGPDGVLALGIDRADMTPVGPIDPALSIGGPAYSSAVVTDADAIGAVFTGVLGYENRREFTFTSAGPQGGLALPAGTQVRFQQWFSPGARTGYVIAMDLLNAGKPAPAPPGLRTRGLVMWSFAVADLDALEARARTAGVPVAAGPVRLDLPGVGRVRALRLITPDGFPIEVYERPADP